MDGPVAVRVSLLPNRLSRAPLVMATVAIVMVSDTPAIWSGSRMVTSLSTTCTGTWLRAV